MIDIQIVPEEFSYDVQSLVQAFYPGQPFQVNRDVADAYRILKVQYTENKIITSLWSGRQKLFEECLDWDCIAVFDKEHAPENVRKETKNILKRLLYGLMVKDTGKELPWGNLTGIRPAKIPGQLLREGKNETQVRKIMKDTYLISDEKLDLALDIAKKENRILEDIPYTEGYSLYVGIPFCPTTCLYCSFTSYPISLYQKKTDAYVEAVTKEIEYLGEKLHGRILNTVYIGGGTPTTLSAVQLDRLIKALKYHFDFSSVKEFTVEAGRPDSITVEKLETLKENGVTRISINPQTMNQATLDLIGRKHTVEQVYEAFKIARDCGFSNINMDFILGLPQEDEKMVRYSLEEAMKLNPEGLTVHSLALKRASRLNIQREDYAHLQMKNDLKQMELAHVYAKKMNMNPYYLYRQKNISGNQENIGYAKEGYEGLYNILMMGDYQDVWAVGAGAVTKLLPQSDFEGYQNALRIDTVKNVDQYIERIDELIERKAKVFV